MKIYQKKINIQLEKDRVTAKKALNSGNKQYEQWFQFLHYAFYRYTIWLPHLTMLLVVLFFLGNPNPDNSQTFNPANLRLCTTQNTGLTVFISVFETWRSLKLRREIKLITDEIEDNVACSYWTSIKPVLLI